MSRSASSLKFVLVFLASVIGLVWLLSSFIVAVDPFNYFSTHGADTGARSRIDQLPYLRLSKPQQLRQIKPSALIIGSSRAASLPANYSSWSGSNAYNLAIPGASLYEMRRFLEHAQSLHAVESLLIALDFELFVPPISTTLDSDLETRLLRKPGDKWRWSYRARQLQALQQAGFSSVALSQSVRVFRDLDLTGSGARQFRADGGWSSPGAAMQDLRSLRYSVNTVLAKHGRRKPETTLQWQSYRDLLEFCFAEEIKVQIVLTPVHVFYLQRQFALGYRDLWQQWHRDLLAVNAELAARYGVSEPAVLAFNHDAEFVSEAIAVSKPSTASWFRDATHFRESYGKKIIAAALDDGEKGLAYTLQPDVVATYTKEVQALVDAFKAEG